MEERTAGVDDIRYIAILLIGSWGEERFTKLAKDPSGIFKLKQDRSDAVGAHWANTVSEHQPACFGLDRRSAVAELNDFPRFRWRLACEPLFPPTRILRVGDRIGL